MNIILFNPLSNNGKSIKALNKYIKICNKNKEEYKVLDITKEKLEKFNDSDILIVIGGDGSLHTITNQLKSLNLKNKIYLYKGGSANDFSRDFKSKLIDITKYIEHTPKSNDHYFLTSSGFGADGEVCDNVNNDNKSNYYKVAVNTVKNFKRFSLKVIVDEKEYNFYDVWFATVMNGRCVGGGMILSPKSNRLDDYLEVCIIHKMGVFKLLRIFPTIFIGKHTIFKKNICIIKGKNIEMVADETQVMQSDGEIYGRVKTIKATF